MTSRWEALLGPGSVVIDGGLSTQLEARGHDVHDPLWTGRVLLESPEEVARAHSDFVDAGADVVITASYQVSRRGFEAAGLPARAADDALRASVETAREATRGSTVRVAASIGPYGAVLHDGSEYRGRYGLSHAALVDFHAERLEVLVDAVPDLLAIETIPDLEEAEALVEVLAAAPAMPAWLTFSAMDGERTCAGQPIEDAVAVAMTAPSIAAVGVNCTDPRFVTELVGRIRSVTELPIVIYPNAGGTWNPVEGSWSVEASPTFDPDVVAQWLSAGAVAIGGCCGMDAQAIADLAHQLRA